MLPFSGEKCEFFAKGFTFNVGKVPGQVTYRYIPPESTTKDLISFGFITCKPNGLMAKISGSNAYEYIKIYMQSSRVIAEYALGSRAGIVQSQRIYDDSKVYTVQFTREGTKGSLKIVANDGTTKEVIPISVITGDNVLNDLTTLEIGSEWVNGAYVNPFEGTIFGFKHNRIPVLELASNLHSQTAVKRPGTQLVTGDHLAQFECQATPVPLCRAGLRPCQNFGVCENDRCNCSLTSWTGPTCETEDYGIYYGYNQFDAGVLVYEYPQAITTDEDYLAVGFMTYEPTGTIFRAQSADNSQYYHIRMVNGKAQLEYNLNGVPKVITEDRALLNSTESIYHVIRMNRTGSDITFYVDNMQINVTDASIAGIPFRHQKVLTAGGIYRDNGQIDDDFNGIIAGLNYNTIKVLELKSDRHQVRIVGDTGIAPHPFKLKLPPPPACQQCANGGRKLKNGLCDCTYTTWGGTCCDTRDHLMHGFQHKKYGENSVLVYTNSEIGGTNIDDLSVAFRTAKGWEDGEILRIESKNGKQYVIIETVGNNLQVRHNIGGQESVERYNDDIRDHNDHVVRLHRVGSHGNITLDKTLRSVIFSGADIFDSNVIFVGGKLSSSGEVTNGHYGYIWGLNYNGFDIVETALVPPSTGIQVTTTGHGNFDIVPLPFPALCDKGSVEQGCGAEVVAPTAAGGAGGVIPQFGSVTAVVGGTGSLATGGPAVSMGAIIGAIMGGLLMSSAIAWAASGMKPGFIALSKGMAGAAGKGAYVPVAAGEKVGAFPSSNGGGKYIGTIGMEEYGGGGGGMGGSQAGSRRSQYEESFNESRFDATDNGMANTAMMNGINGVNNMNSMNSYNNQYNTTSSSWFQRNETLENQHGYGMGGTMGSTYGNGRAGYAGSVAGGSVAGSVYGFGTVTNPEQAFITLSEDIAVDNVVLTADGRYVVTGSNLGPPQVWNTSVSTSMLAKAKTSQMLDYSI